MSKCMYQECNNEATMVIPCVIGPKEIKEDIYVCNFHFHYLRQPEPFVSYEMRVLKTKEDKKNDRLEELE